MSADKTLQGRPAANVPSVGIVWRVDGAATPLLLVTDHTPLRDAEPYGTFLTHPRGHFEVWEGWRRLGPSGLVRQGLPTSITWHEYEHFPRGRVVFDVVIGRFILYADRRLQDEATVSAIIDRFGLRHEPCDVRSDPHYQATPDL